MSNPRASKIGAQEERGIWLGGEERLGRGPIVWVRSPFSEEVQASVATASPEDVADAVGLAQSCFKSTMRLTPVHRRAAILMKAADLLTAQAERMAVMLARETGKPITLCRTETRRGHEILRLAAEAARSVTGEIVPLDALPGADGRLGLAVRVPLGVVAAISPFNAPVNLSLQKVAPALAAGCTVVLKPADATPLTVLMLGEIFAEAGLPRGALSILPGSAETGESLVSDPRVAVVSFTGSAAVAREIQRLVGIKKLIYELGANSPNIVCSDADIELAATSLVGAAFNSSGQICVSAQRLYIHEEVYEPFLRRMIELMENIRIGDPMDESVTMGTLISPDALERIDRWVQEAVRDGARVIKGGARHSGGRNYLPTLLTDVTRSMKVQADEIFGPVATVTSFTEDEEAIRMANDSPYGLRAGVFTRDLERAFRYVRDLEVGGVNINDGSRFRQDNTPSCGVKNSGVGREGGRYAYEEYTYLKFATMRFSGDVPQRKG